jgi:hypothetical protein
LTLANLPSKLEASIGKTIVASPSSRKRHPPGFTVLAAVDSCRRLMGIRADRSSNGGCAVFNKPRTKIQNDRPSAIAYRDCSAPVPARKRGVSSKTFPPEGN